MNALIIGGDRHGEWVDVFDGSTAWVDIRTATTFRIRKLGWEVTRIGQGGAELTGEKYNVPLAVHPDLTLAGAVTEQQVVTQLLQMLAMNEFIRAHGELVARMKSFGYYLGEQIEPIYDDATWEQVKDQYREDHQTIEQVIRPTERIFYIQYGPNPDDVCRWEDATCQVIATPAINNELHGRSAS